jgi:hypothetical protein
VAGLIGYPVSRRFSIKRAVEEEVEEDFKKNMKKSKKQAVKDNPPAASFNYFLSL